MNIHTRRKGHLFDDVIFPQLKDTGTAVRMAVTFWKVLPGREKKRFEMWPWLAWNSQRLARLHLLGAGINGVRHHSQLILNFFFFNLVLTNELCSLYRNY